MTITRFITLLLAAAFAAGTLSGCGGTEKQAKKEEDKKIQRVQSAELSAVDQRLDGVEAQSDQVRDKVSALQDKVADHVGTDAAKLQTELDGSATYIEVDKNNVIRVNGIAMSSSDFGVYTQRRGKELCAPAPTLVTHTAADYEVVAKLLDMIYAEGCSTVDIQQVKK